MQTQFQRQLEAKKFTTGFAKILVIMKVSKIDLQHEAIIADIGPKFKRKILTRFKNLIITMSFVQNICPENRFFAVYISVWIHLQPRSGLFLNVIYIRKEKLYPDILSVKTNKK